MKSHSAKLTEFEERINIQNSPPKVCVVFQGGKTMNGADPEYARIVVNIGGLDLDDI